MTTLKYDLGKCRPFVIPVFLIAISEDKQYFISRNYCSQERLLKLRGCFQRVMGERCSGWIPA